MKASLPPPRAFRYGEHPSQTATLHRPAGEHPARVVCLLHGGFWAMPYAADQMTPLAEDLARRGYAAWNLEYRRIRGGGGWPTTFDDVRAGIEHLAAVAAGGVAIDPRGVITVGHSAGGHLALWAATQALAIDAACGQAPVADLRRAYELGLGHGVVAELLGGSPDEVPERYRDASPRDRPPTVPQLLVHGDADDYVPIEISRAYAAAVPAATLRVIAGGDHFQHLDPNSDSWRAVVAWLERLAPIAAHTAPRE